MSSVSKQELKVNQDIVRDTIKMEQNNSNTKSISNGSKTETKTEIPKGGYLIDMRKAPKGADPKDFIISHTPDIIQPKIKSPQEVNIGPVSSVAKGGRTLTSQKSEIE